MLKIVNYATIKETEKLKETMVGVQVDLAGGHQYPYGSGSVKKLSGLGGWPPISTSNRFSQQTMEFMSKAWR